MRHDDCVICHDEALAAPSPALKPRITSPSSSMDSSSTGYSLLLCFMVFFYIPVAVSSICSYPERQISHVQLIFAVVLLTTVFISLFALVATIHTVFIGHYVPDFRAPTLSPYAALVAYSLASSCVLLLHATSPECIQDTMSFKAAWLCKIDGNLSAFPLLVSLTSPVVVASLLPATPHFTTASTYTLCLTWLITLVTLCACVGLTLSSSTIMTAVAYIFLSLTVCSSQLAKRTMTPTSRGLDEPSRALHSKAEMPCSIYERDSVGSDFSKDLMRQLIANVAHDLKTPLSSFMTGIDIITELLFDCRQHLRDETLSTEFVRDMVGSLHQCVCDIRVTNSFMLMTINRCIDYTKASKGLKLVPKFETTELLETLLLPLSCMKNIQNKVHIELLSLPASICSHVITDKQWLQENVLCLLSNAVKYSASGKISVAVSLALDTSSTGGNSSPSSPASSPQRQAAARKTSSLALLPRSTSSSHINFRRVCPLSLSSASAEDLGIKPDKYVLRVEVEDEGIGMTEQAMSELFSPFKQTQRLAGGTGLGLFSLAKRIEALRGQCGVCRRRDGKQGSLFWFTIPYRPDEEERRKKKDADGGLSRVVSVDSIGDVSNLNCTIDEEAIMHSPYPPATISAADMMTQPMVSHSAEAQLIPVAIQTNSSMHSQSSNQASAPFRILLVDDSPSVLKMMSMMLRRQGHVVTIAENGAIALDLLTSRLSSRSTEQSASAVSTIFDIVLMDLQMPVMDGIEAVKRLRQFEAQRLAIANTTGYVDQTSRNTVHDDHAVRMSSQSRQLVIGLSANCEDDVLQETASVGFDAFLPKPFSLNSFLELVNELHVVQTALLEI